MALILGVVVNLLVFAGVNLPVVRSVLGFWFVLVFPAYLIFTTSAWRRCGLPDRLGYSVGAALLILMLVGLAVNEAFPVIGVKRPMDASPVMITVDVINVVLYLVRRCYPNRVRLRGAFTGLGKEEFRLLIAASLAVVLAVLGANRLNNGSSGDVTLVALALAAVVGVFSFRWLSVTREPFMLIVIYLTGLSLLLTTSLRGWYVTGHDIQQEYQVFQLTEARGHWSMANLQGAYNACLSITILPTEFGRIINVDNPYVFKLFFQVIFALCPVLAYGIARRYFSQGIATLSVAYFIGFPTFFTDMPFLNRQEISLVFVAVGVLAATNPAWSLRRRQISLAVAGIGVELSHYSTMYVLMGTLVIALICSYVTRPFTRGDRDRPVQRKERRWAHGSSITLGAVSVLVGIIFVWGTLVTETTTQVLDAGSSALSSGSLSLSNFGSVAIPPNVAIQQLRDSSLNGRTTADQQRYLPTPAVSKAPTPVVDQALNPLTGMGRAASSIGIPVEALDSFARNFVAYGEELFLGIGLLRLVIASRRGQRMVPPQFLWLAVGSIGMIVANTVLPSIAADYGPLRAFQQGLLFFAPMIVIGSMTVLEPIGKHRARVAACVLCLLVFLSTSTVVPQLLGGNLAELNLNNRGLYYDLYYMTAEQSSAISWLGRQPKVLASPVQSGFLQEKFMFNGPSDVNGDEVITDFYPTLVLRSSWVILAPPTVGDDTAYTFTPSNGALTEYKYPTSVLNQNKNLVYTDGSTVIYKLPGEPAR